MNHEQMLTYMSNIKLLDVRHFQINVFFINKPHILNLHKCILT